MKRFRGFQFDSFEITIREILVSISIISVMLIIGFLISSKITEKQLDDNEEYNKAAKITRTDLFKYGMETNVGNAFVYGELKAVDSVGYEDISGKYMYVKRIKEMYQKHTRIVTHTRTVNGKTETYTELEEYWTWDAIDSCSKHSKFISFCNEKFKYEKIKIPSANYIDTIYKSNRVRFVYYGVNIRHKGTIYTKLKNKTISDKTDFYENKNIDETVNYLESDVGIVIFWIVWILLIIAVVVYFYYFDNEWLEA